MIGDTGWFLRYGEEWDDRGGGGRVIEVRGQEARGQKGKFSSAVVTLI